MVQRTVLKVNIACQKCKKELLKAVAVLQGVDEIEVDEAKGTLTITGTADPYEIIIRTKKTGKFAEVVSIGPPPAPPKPDQEPDVVVPVVHHPPYYICPLCERMAVVHVDHYQEPTSRCSIL